MMVTRKSSHSETIYGFSCTSSSTTATEKLLSVSDTNQYNMTREKLPLETFLEVMDKKKSEPYDKGVQQRKVKAAASGEALTENGSHYAFTHFDDLEKYIQRYRYYHTVFDTGQTQMDPHTLGIEIPERSSNKHRSFRSVSSGEPSVEDFRNMQLLLSRRSVSDMSSSTTRRNKSAPCSQNPKTSKRVYLTWEQYVEMCGTDVIPRRGQFNLKTAVSDESGQTTDTIVTRRKVSSAYPPRRTSCLDLRLVTSRGKDNGNLKEKHTENDSDKVKTETFLGAASVKPSSMPHEKFDICLSEHQRKLAQKETAKLESADKQTHDKTARKKEQANRFPTAEGSLQSVKDKQRKKTTPLPESHLEQGMSSVLISGKRSAEHEQLKKITSYRCRNSRVSAVYKFTKVRRKQIHL